MKNRIIKFRAWDKIREQMFLNVEYGVDLGLWQPFGSVLEIHDDMIDFEVMQFTGLLDKNGKEIFEGDIVEIYCGVTKESNLHGVVEYIAPNFCINNNQVSRINAHPIEIIGNVFENPELLNN